MSVPQQRLIIVGAGGFGREILAWSEAACPESDWHIAGFLDGNQDSLRRFKIDLPILGTPDSYLPQEGDRFVCAIGYPATKLRLCRSLQDRGAQFINLIHPTAIIGPRCILGTGAILCPFTLLTVDITLGNFVTLNARAGVGHDCVVGDGCTLNAFCDVTGGSRLGEGVFLGSHAVIAPGTTVGDYARVGAGSVVIRRVRPKSTVMGVPAKRLEIPDTGEQ